MKIKRPRPVKPKPGQESVWDYPRPPRLEPCHRRVRVVFNGTTIADSTRTFRILETSHPPVYYIPPGDIRLEHLERGTGGSTCEWKGEAAYFSLIVAGRRVERAAWGYSNPTPAYAPIKDHLAFYAGSMDACFVDEERVMPQPGGFYGGWITREIVGPFKGEPGTWGW